MKFSSSKKIFLLVLVGTYLVSCSNLSLSSIAENTQPDYYFPIEPFQDSTFPGSAKANIYYSEYLRAFEEESLFKETGEHTIYRFTWLRSFANPIVVRAENFNGKLAVYWKVMGGMGGYEPDTLIQNERNGISFQNWVKLESLITDINFWNLPIGETNPPNTDGSSWLIEGYKNGTYHCIHRRSPRSAENAYLLGVMLLNLTDIYLSQENIY